MPSQANIGTASGPLSGIRVIEIGHFVAAPFCCRLLADLGAEVIKIEPEGGDPVRSWGRPKNGRTAWWSVHGRNKQSMTVNLKTESGRQIILELVAASDVLVENFRPGQLAKLGLSDEMFRKANERIIIAHISGFGQDGPDRNKSGFGAIGEAMGGLRYLTNHEAGQTDLPPARVGVSIGDSLAGMYAAIGILAALWQRDHTGGTGRGQSVDVALTEAVLSIMEGVVPEYSVFGDIRQPVGARIPTAAPSSAYQSLDGKWVIIAANSQPLFKRLCDLMGQPGLISDARFDSNSSRVKNVAVLDGIITAWTSTLDAKTLVGQLEKANIPGSTIYDAADIAHDAQFLARGMVREIQDPVIGPVLHPGIVPHMPDCPGGIRWPGREIGEDTEQILKCILRKSAAEVSDLRHEGAI